MSILRKRRTTMQTTIFFPSSIASRPYFLSLKGMYKAFVVISFCHQLRFVLTGTTWSSMCYGEKEQDRGYFSVSITQVSSQGPEIDSISYSKLKEVSAVFSNSFKARSCCLRDLYGPCQFATWLLRQRFQYPSRLCTTIEDTPLSWDARCDKLLWC